MKTLITYDASIDEKGNMFVSMSFKPAVLLTAEVRATQASGSGEVVVATAHDTTSTGGAYHILTDAITIQMPLMSKEDYTQS